MGENDNNQSNGAGTALLWVIGIIFFLFVIGWNMAA